MTSLLTLASLTREGDWFQLLLDVSLKGILVLVVTCAMAVALRRASAAARHLLWSVAVASLLVLPVLEVMLPNWRVPILPSVTTQVSSHEDRLHRGDASQNAAQTLGGSGDASLTGGTQTLSTEPTTTGVEGSAAAHDYLSMETPVFGDLQVEGAAASAPVSEASPYWALALLLIWMTGASAVLIRLGLATARVWWIARRAEPMTEDKWTRLARPLAKQLRLNKQTTLLRTGEISMPVAWGVFRPVVLLPNDADEWSEDWRRIVLLHELSHIKRGDCLTQTLAQVACALHWFNPLAWSAARRLRVEREIACDDQVIEAGTRATDYASYLIEIASSFEPVTFAPPMVAGMACSQLESRVRSILNPGIRRKGLNRFRVGLTSFAAISLVVPLSVVRPWSSASASARPDKGSASNATGLNVIDEHDARERTESRLIENAASQVRVITSEKSSEVAPGEMNPNNAANQGSEAGEIQQEGSGKGTGLGQGTGQSSGEGAGKGEGVGQSTGQGKGQVSGKGEGKGEGREDSAVDRIVQMKTYNITPEFLESVKRMGFDNPSLKQIIQLRIHAVDEGFLSQVRGWGYDKVSLDQLVHLKVAGVDSAYVAAIRKAGYENLSVNKLVSMKLLGVTPDFIESMRRSGYDKLTAEQLSSLRAQGITESFIREAQSWGFGKLSINDVRQIKIFNISPAYAGEMRGLGFQNLPLAKLIQTRIHGVDSGFVQEMRGLGFTDLSVDDLIRARIHGVTPDYVRKMRAAGFKNVSLNKMIEMKISGIDEILLRNSR